MEDLTGARFPAFPSFSMQSLNSATLWNLSSGFLLRAFTTVVEELQKGYLLNDKVIRTAKVKVSSKSTRAPGHQATS
jgi:hypothetical protein